MSIPAPQDVYRLFVQRFPRALANGWTLSPEYPGQPEYAKYYIVSPPQTSECYSWASMESRVITWAGMEIQIPSFFWNDETMPTIPPPAMSLPSMLEDIGRGALANNVFNTLSALDPLDSYFGPALVETPKSPSEVYLSNEYRAIDAITGPPIVFEPSKTGPSKTDMVFIDLPGVEKCTEQITDVTVGAGASSASSSNDVLPVVAIAPPTSLPSSGHTASTPAVGSAGTTTRGTKRKASIFLEERAVITTAKVTKPSLPAPIVVAARRSYAANPDLLPRFIPATDQYMKEGVPFFKFQDSNFKIHTVHRDLFSNTIAPLKRLAGAVGLTRFSALRKDELIGEIRKFLIFE